jgi:hypothetical protein
VMASHGGTQEEGSRLMGTRVETVRTKETMTTNETMIRTLGHDAVAHTGRVTQRRLPEGSHRDATTSP